MRCNAHGHVISGEVIAASFPQQWGQLLLNSSAQRVTREINPISTQINTETSRQIRHLFAQGGGNGNLDRINPSTNSIACLSGV